MTDQKNTLLAIVLSAIVLIGWQYFFGLPQMEKQRQEAQIKAQQQAQTPAQPAPGQAAPGQAPGQAAQLPGQGGAATPTHGPLIEKSDTAPDSSTEATVRT